MKRTLFLTSGLGIAVIVGWLIVNPVGQFGKCFYAFTVFNSVPYPLMDLQIRADGTHRRISKTHDLKLDQLQWLLESEPDLLIVSLGWDGAGVGAGEETQRVAGETARAWIQAGGGGFFAEGTDPRGRGWSCSFIETGRTRVRM